MRGKLVIITLQEKFLHMNLEYLAALLGEHLEIRAVSLNELTTSPPLSEETILYFAPGIKAMVERLYPECTTYIQASREILICNIKELFCLGKMAKNILVVNDGKGNTEEMVQDLSLMGLPHLFTGYYPGQQVPEDIDCIVTSGERALIPHELQNLPVIDCGIRFISFTSICSIFDHFSIPYNPAILARKHQQTVVTLSEKWPTFGSDRFVSPWFGAAWEQGAEVTFADCITASPVMKKFVLHTARMAATDNPVHIHGETGTGKRMISQAIHNGSRRKGRPFWAINCAARNPDILGKELFGWESDDLIQHGLWESAGEGTLCIEEVGVLDDDLQTRLLQGLTEKRIIRMGGSSYVDVSARIVTTSSSLLDKGADTTFNRSLLLFLSRYSCRIPTLNERVEDFDDLIHSYLERHLQRNGTDISVEAISDLKKYHWHGNVQELYNVLQYMSCTGEKTLTREDLPYFITSREDYANRPDSSANNEDNDIQHICRKIEQYGFLAETIAILKTYLLGKHTNTSYGRTPLQRLLAKQGILLSPQQLRLRLEKLNDLGLLLIRPGRGGTTISNKGEIILKSLQSNAR